MKKFFYCLVLASSTFFTSCNDSTENKSEDPGRDTLLRTPSGDTKDTAGWVAWVNAMPGTSKPKLIVTGNLLAGPEQVKYDLVMAEPQGINAQILILEVKPQPTVGSNNVPLRYEQEVQGKDQYTSIEIRIPGRASVMINKIDEAL